VKPIPRWNLVAAGCGTVNLACVRELARGAAAEGLDSVTLIDPAAIREVNAITCPEYAGSEGTHKVERLAELLHRWHEGSTVEALPKDVEDVDWKGLLAPGDASGPTARPVVVLIGLDDWQSRLHVIEDLRHAAQGRSEILPVQAAVERDQAQVTVFGNRWQDACPACGLLELPASEPCALYSDEGQLVRGDLQREARAAAELVAEIVADHLAANGAPCTWARTKTNLHAVRPGSRRFKRHTRPRVGLSGCLGPHSEATPLRPEDLFDEEDQHHVCGV